MHGVDHIVCFIRVVLMVVQLNPMIIMDCLIGTNGYVNVNFF